MVYSISLHMEEKKIYKFFFSPSLNFWHYSIQISRLLMPIPIKPRIISYRIPIRCTHRYRRPKNALLVIMTILKVSIILISFKITSSMIYSEIRGLLSHSKGIMIAVKIFYSIPESYPGIYSLIPVLRGITFRNFLKWYL